MGRGAPNCQGYFVCPLGTHFLFTEESIYTKPVLSRVFVKTILSDFMKFDGLAFAVSVLSLLKPSP